MPRPAPSPPDSVPGYSLLLWVDLTTGRHNGSETIFVPLVLAQTLNAARRELYDKHDKPDAWGRACVIRTPPLPPEDELDLDPEDSDARLRALRGQMQASAATSTPPASPPAAPVATLARRKRQTVTGHPVPVISAALITERRKSVEQRTKFTSEEKKTEFKVMDDLLARGETRLVGLKADWRARIAQMRTDMPNLSKVIDRLEACCALSAFARKPLRIPPLLLVGPPGVGKTHLLMILRKCVQRHGRVMEAVCVDGGKEFSSVYWDTTCALYNIKIIRRPTAQARFGSQIERFFGTTNTNFFNFLQGNTQLRKNVRQLTAEVDPDAHAVWTLPELNKALSNYFYEVYDTLEHRTLLTTPRFAFEKSLERHGSRPHTCVLYNELFRITTSPAPAKGEAKVQRDGVRISYLYYTCPELQQHLGKTVKVRYDPFDKSLAWAFANGRWLRLKSRNQELFRSLTEHDVDLAATEWRKRRSNVEKNRLSEPVLVKFLKEIMNTETLLLARRRAAEERRLREQEAEDGGSFDDGYDDDSLPETTGAAGKPQPKPAAPAATPTFADIGADIELAETF